MSAGASGDRRKTSDELLRQLITDDEYLAVLEYGREEGLEKDSTVLFLVSLLKVFAFAFDRFLHIIEIAEAGRSTLLAATRQSETRIDNTLTSNRELIKEVLSENVAKMAFYVGEMNSAMGAIRVVNEELEKTANEAKGVYQFYNRLSGDGVTGSLSQHFQRAVILAHEKAMPEYQDRLTKMIGIKLGGFAILVGIMTVEMLILGVVIALWK